jgi:chemotaxis protein CheZ
MSQSEALPSVAGAHQALHKLSQELPDACERLDYVKRMTDQAASKVLTLVDAAQDDAVSQDLTVERARAMMRLCAAYAASAAGFAERVKGLQTEIMMAQDFQDLSGQVINKVLGMLRPAEAPLQELLAQFEAAEPAAEEQLAGVQTPDKALQQDDVDALLAEMGF